MSCTGSIWLFPCCIRHSFSRLSVSFCFILAQSPEKVIWLTQALCRSRSPISRRSWDASDSCCVHLRGAGCLGDVGTCQVCFPPFSLLYHLYPLEDELQVARRRWIKICSTWGTEVCVGGGFLNVHFEYSQCGVWFSPKALHLQVFH